MDPRMLERIGEVDRTHWWFVVRRRIVLDAIARCTGEPDRVLEVGCGPEGVLGDLGRLFPDAEVSGVEPSETAAAIARSRGLTVTDGSFERLPAEDGSVGLAVALDVLEHCADDRAALAEAARVLRPGAPLVLAVPALPALWSAHDEVNEHRRRYTRSSLAAAIEGAGLRVERLTYFNTLLLPVGWIHRRLTRAEAAHDDAVRVPARPLNAALRAVFGLERPWLRRFDLPIGMSLLAVARRPG